MTTFAALHRKQSSYPPGKKAPTEAPPPDPPLPPFPLPDPAAVPALPPPYATKVSKMVLPPVTEGGGAEAGVCVDCTVEEDCDGCKAATRSGHGLGTYAQDRYTWSVGPTHRGADALCLNLLRPQPSQASTFSGFFYNWHTAPVSHSARCPCLLSHAGLDTLLLSHTQMCYQCYFHMSQHICALIVHLPHNLCQVLKAQPPSLSSPGIALVPFWGTPSAQTQLAGAPPSPTIPRYRVPGVTGYEVLCSTPPPPPPPPWYAPPPPPPGSRARGQLEMRQRGSGGYRWQVWQGSQA
jgi:hypothetical protein